MLCMTSSLKKFFEFHNISPWLFLLVYIPMYIPGILIH